MPEEKEYYVQRSIRGNGYAYALYEITSEQKKELIAIDAKRKVMQAEFNKKYDADGNFRLYIDDKMTLNPNKAAVDAYFQIGRLDDQYNLVATKNGVARIVGASEGTIFIKRKDRTVELGKGATGVFAKPGEIQDLLDDGKLKVIMQRKSLKL